MNDRRILVVDDEAELLEMVKSIFERARFTQILMATSGEAALKIYKEKQPDMMILDVMMPGMDGFTTLKELRKKSKIPVLMLTARGEAEDKFAGFENGADDYLLKPFLPKELLFRVQAILKRAYPEKERKVFLDTATVDLKKAIVQRNGESISLTAKEFQLFEKLYENEGRIVTTGSLCQAICGDFWQRYESTLATHIRHLSEGKPIHLEEAGELAEINAGLNRAGTYLVKKDNTRAEWIRGISHDIRTPLSMILGYASEIEETVSLPEATRKQAEIIRRNSEKLKDLVSDLNLTTKLEYAIQPMERQLLNAVELARQAVSEVLNSGLPNKYELRLLEDNPGKIIMITDDRTLFSRMLCNLIQNSVVHNPDGCKIQVLVGSNDKECIFSVIDDGKGIDASQLNAFNDGQAIFSTQKLDEGTEHGLGLKIVRQIVKAHRGSLLFFDTIPQGLTAKVYIPTET